MAEPIFDQDIFEPEDKPEETLDDIINRAPQPIADTLKGMNLLLNPPLSRLSNTLNAPLFAEPEFMVDQFDLDSDHDRNRLEKVLNDDWMLKDSFSVSDSLRVTMILIRMKKQEDNANG